MFFYLEKRNFILFKILVKKIKYLPVCPPFYLEMGKIVVNLGS